MLNASFLPVPELQVSTPRINSTWQKKGGSAVSSCYRGSPAVADSGGAKDHLPLTMAPGTQGPQPSVWEMPQSSGVLMLD